MLLSVANMHLKLGHPTLAAPLYYFVLTAEGASDRERRMAASRLEGANEKARANAGLPPLPRKLPPSQPKSPQPKSPTKGKENKTLAPEPIKEGQGWSAPREAALAASPEPPEAAVDGGFVSVSASGLRGAHSVRSESIAGASADTSSAVATSSAL